MRIAFFGSPADAVPALQILHGQGFEIGAVYTRPDRPSGRSSKPQPTPVREAAEALGLEVRTPGSMRSDESTESLVSLGLDALVVVAYGRILPPEALAAARLGAVNIHPSLLPKYRGPSPVASAIRDGVSKTGVTVMLLDEGMDTGPVLVQEQVSLDGTERCGELTSRLFKIGGQLVPGVLRNLDSGSLKPTPQDESRASTTKLLKREDGLLDWSRPVAEIERLVRAYDPWPGTHTAWKGKTLKILEATLSAETLEPGTVAIRGRRLLVGCGEGALELRRVQLEGRKAATASEFLNGNPTFGSSHF